jgi:hypothetical protein
MTASRRIHPAPVVGTIVCWTYAPQTVGVIAAVGPGVIYRDPALEVRWVNGQTTRTTADRLFDYDSVIAGFAARLDEALRRRAKAASRLVS